MWGGAPRNSLQGLLLGEGSHIPYLMERIPEVIFFSRPVNRVADFIANQIKKTRVEDQIIGLPGIGDARASANSPFLISGRPPGTIRAPKEPILSGVRARALHLFHLCQNPSN